jgi:hypothetical protein
VSSREEIEKLAKILGLELDVDSYLKAAEECARKLAEGKELRRRSADWAYIESRPEPLKTALKLLVETGDVKLVSAVTGIPVEALECERIEARIPRLVV